MVLDFQVRYYVLSACVGIRTYEIVQDVVFVPVVTGDARNWERCRVLPCWEV